MPGLLASVAGLAAAICVGLAFIAAGATKLRHRALLSGVIANYRLLPEPLVPAAAAALPLAELAVGTALLLGEGRVAPAMAMAMLAAFAFAMAVNIRRGRAHIDCGCGQSSLRQTLSWTLVARNLILAAVLALRLAAPAPEDVPQLLVAAASGLALFLVYLLFNLVIALAAPRPSHNFN